MSATVFQYLGVVKENLRLDTASETEVLDELKTHIEDEVEEMKGSGLSEEEATSRCLELLGSAKQLAREIYEAHSQGTWRQALMASMPHLLFALIFALNRWQGVGPLAAVLGLLIVTVIYGWWRGKPIWLFPWLGYCVVPVLGGGLFLLYLPSGWSWIAILVYVPLAMWLVTSFAVHTIKRDWLYSALMLLPIPIIIGWFLAVGRDGTLIKGDPGLIEDYSRWIGLSFLAMAATAGAFVRLRKRWLRLVLLIISGNLTLIMVTSYTQGRIGLVSFIALTIIALALLFSPALIDRWMRNGKQRPPA